MDALTLALGVQVHLETIAETAGLPVERVSHILTVGSNKMKPHSQRPNGAEFKAIYQSLMQVLDISADQALAITRFGVLNFRRSKS